MIESNLIESKPKINQRMSHIYCDTDSNRIIYSEESVFAEEGSVRGSFGCRLLSTVRTGINKIVSRVDSSRKVKELFVLLLTFNPIFK